MQAGDEEQLKSLVTIQKNTETAVGDRTYYKKGTGNAMREGCRYGGLRFKKDHKTATIGPFLTFGFDARAPKVE